MTRNVKVRGASQQFDASIRPGDPWHLVDYITMQPLSSHPNEEGAKLASLFHVEKGDLIYWYDSRVSVEIAG